jgi:lambda family phage portal protein
MARAWLRDGEVFAQMITGTRPDIDHGTLVPFSLEAFEAELVPMDYFDPSKNILQGIERNTWGKPVAIHVLKTNPASLGQSYSIGGSDTKRIPWDRMLHLATLDHIGQIRGVSEFASIINRLEDIKDYEESERVAAKIAAMLTAYVKRGTPDLYDPTDPNAATGREINFKPGMIIDDLAVGEDIGLIDSNRPNPNLITFRQGQLRAVASGVGASNSSISKDYNGTYSAQRQELVEQWAHYAVLCDEFVGEIVQPVWEQFVLAAHLSGVVRMPADLKPGTHNDAMYTAQAMPWIDPLKEAKAWQELVAAGFASEYEAIRRRGANPENVLEQIKEFREKAEKAGLHFTTMPDAVAPPPASDTAPVADAPAARAEIDRIHARIDTINRPTPEPVAAPAPSPQPISVAVHLAPAAPTEIHNHVEPAAAPIVNIENVAPAQPAPIVTIEAIMPEQQAPIVNVTNQQEAASVTVNLPARKTETSVTRDAAGQIIGSTQIETDADE